MPDQEIEVMLEHAWKLLEVNQLAEARAAFAQICGIDGNNPESWMMLGTLHTEFFDYEAGVKCLEKAISLDSHYADAHYNLANARLKQDQWELALAHTQMAITCDPEYIDAWHLLGVVQGKLGDYSEAASSSRKATELDPGNAASHANLGLALWNIKELQEAITSYRRALQLNSTVLETWIQLALIYTTLNMDPETEECYRKAISIAPAHVHAYEKLGYILIRQGEIEEAIPVLREGWKLAPDNIGINLWLGIGLQNQRKNGQALTYFRTVIKLDPDNVVALIGIGSILEMKGKREESLNHLKLALHLDPENEQLIYHIARIEGNSVPDTAPPDYVRRLFDDYADRFDSHLVEQLDYKAPELIHAAVMAAIEPEHGTLDLLDLGCGTGLCAPLFKDVTSRMVGVDLSEKMVEAAKKRNLYDELVVSDITTALKGVEQRYDLIIAADVFVYIGKLDEIAQACKTALKSGGVFAFTIEALKEGTGMFVLRGSGRYAHSIEYVRTLAAASYMNIVTLNPVVLRMEKGEPMDGYVVILRN